MDYKFNAEDWALYGCQVCQSKNFVFDWNKELASCKECGYEEKISLPKAE